MLVSIYVSFTPPLSHHGSRDPCTPRNATCIPVYWRAHMRDLQLHSTEQHGQLDLLIVCHKGYRWIQVYQVNNVQTHGLNRFSLLRHWSCSCPATCQHTCVNQKWLIGCRTILLFHDIHWHRCNTELTTVPVCYLCLYNCTGTCTCSYCYNIISSGSSLVFLECTSYHCMFCEYFLFFLPYSYQLILAGSSTCSYSSYSQGCFEAQGTCLHVFIFHATNPCLFAQLLTMARARGQLSQTIHARQSCCKMIGKMATGADQFW